MKSSPPLVARGRSLIKDLAIWTAFLVLGAVTLEVVLRMNGYGNLEIYQPDPKLYWKLKPDQDCYTKVGHRPVHINSHGTRGAEFVTEKPVNTFRILSLGDSRTFGWGLADSETYSELLRQSLPEKVGRGRRVEVINAGVNAWSYPQMLVYLRDTALKYQPDVVILAEANLWTQFSERNGRDFVRSFMWRVRLKNLLRHLATYHYIVEVRLRSYYERNRTKFIPVDPDRDRLFKEQQQQDPYGVFRSAIQDLCRLARDHGVRPVLLYLPGADELDLTAEPGILKVKREIHDQMNLPLVDPTPDLRPEEKALYLEADRVHFNARGNEIIARRIVAEWDKLMEP